MALIPCPECERDVSSHATVCPGCGFPVSDALQETLAEVTGTESSRPFRHQAAAHKLAAWAGSYTPQNEESQTAPRRSVFRERTTKAAIWLLVLVVVALQLVWVTSALQR